MGDGAGPQSVGVVLSYSDSAPYLCSVVQLHLLEEPPRRRIDAKYTAHFSTEERGMIDDDCPTDAEGEVPLFKLVFSPPVSCTHDLFMLPYKRSIPDWPFSIDKTPLHCATFNCSTNRFQSISPPNPNSVTFNGVTLTVGQDIYYIAHPYFHPRFVDQGQAFFERYIPAKKSWEKHEPFPYYKKLYLEGRCFIKASAVWNDDTILLNLGFLQIWAYLVFERKWYQVHVDRNNHQCYDFVGQAFVVGNTIYALSSKRFDLVLALSIEKRDGVAGGDPEFSCSFRADFLVPRSSSVPHSDNYEECCCTSRSLVRLGKEDLCFVETCEWSAETQPIQLTYIKLMGEGKMVSKGDYCSWLELKADEHFHIGFSFSLPECKTTAFKPCETFIFNPFTGVVSKQGDESRETDFTLEPEVGKPVQEEENVTLPNDPLLNDVDVLAAKSSVASEAKAGHRIRKRKASVCTDEEGRCVVVVYLPPDATPKQVMKGLKRFGRIKKNGIRVENTASDILGFCFAIVEFESVAAVGRAVKASPIIIGGCVVDIVPKLAKRRTSLAKVDMKSARKRGFSSLNYMLKWGRKRRSLH